MENLPAKKLGFGLMRLPLKDREDKSSIDLEQTKVMVDRFMEKGFTYFDTAAPYHKGNSESAFREAVAKRYPRDAYVLADKLSLFMLNEAEEIPGFFHRQIENLGVEYIDYYLLHAVDQNTCEKAERMGAFSFMEQKKAEGKVKHIGFSFHDSAKVLEKILKNHPEMEFVQLQINYLDWEDVNVQAKECLEVAVKYGKPVIVMEPVKGGALARVPEEVTRMFQEYDGKFSDASWAVRFAASCENVFMVLSGMSDENQLLDNMSFMENFEPLTISEIKMLEKAADRIHKHNAIACTACQYCVDDCPKNIAIPDYFALFNGCKRLGTMRKAEAKEQYRELATVRGKASDCIACGKCEAHCPQHLTIRKHLADVAKSLES